MIWPYIFVGSGMFIFFLFTGVVGICSCFKCRCQHEEGELTPQDAWTGDIETEMKIVETEMETAQGETSV